MSLLLFFFLSVIGGALLYILSLHRKVRDLQVTQFKIETLMKVAPAALFQATPDGQCLFVNQAWCQFTGLTLKDAIGDGWTSGLLPDDVERVQNAWREGSRKKEPIQVTYRYRSKEGDLRWIHMKGVPYFDEQNELVCYYGASIDFSLHKQIEAELRESRNLLSAILDNLPVAVVCKDVRKDYTYVFANRKSQEMSGRTEGDIVAKTDFDLMPKEQAERVHLEDKQVVETGLVSEVRGKQLHFKDGGEYFTDSRKVPIRDAQGKVAMVLGILEDRTAQKNFEKLIEEQRLKIIHSEKMSALGEMAGGIAHEINNPLAVIELNAGQLKRKLKVANDAPEELAFYAERISGTVQRIAKIVKGLKTFARDGETDPFEPAAIDDLIKEAFEFCQGRFHQHQVNFEMPVLPAHVKVESRAVQLSQVFFNLLNNAYDAVLATKDPWVRVELIDGREMVEIRIIDSGKGIPPEVAAKMMQPFFTTKDIGKGTGLGLSISQAIVKSHQGSLELDTKCPHTCFVVRLPKFQSQVQMRTAA
jgi:PAS domain S-box-containing protein